jgi:formate dehydrogenase beta subunit
MGGFIRVSDINVDIPSIDYWKSQIKCQAACPVHTDARGYVRAISDGNDELAYLIARGPNPLASICGRVCGAPCEAECRRGELDKPVAIRALKRYVCEQFGAEAREDRQTLVDFLKEAAAKHTDRVCEGQEELLPLMQSVMKGSLPAVYGKSVGIIGSGPAGLAAAHDLALLGFKVTIYEVEPVLAGMLAVGIPEYRLPRDLIRAEVEVIEALGVEAVTECEVGVDIAFSDLRERHDAVVVAVGAKRSRLLPIPGVDAKGVLGGVEFLRDVALGNPVDLGQRAVVIGGGNVAYDVGRTVLRQISVDTARTVIREGVGSVYLCSLESLDEMPAEDVEIIEGDEEGIIRRNSMGPVEVQTDDNGWVTGVLFRRCLRVFDDDHNFAPEFDDDDREVIPCDRVLMAIGQGVDLSFLDPDADGIKMTERGFIECDPTTGRSSASDIYVAGDLAYGPKLLIHAVASGKQIARSIYEDVTGRTIRAQDVELHLGIPDYQREQGYERIDRVQIPTATVAERVASQSVPVERGYSESEARCEASRCLDCGVNTIFDGAKCILCGGCVDVCPELCLRIVSVDRLARGEVVDAVLDDRLDGMAREEASAILKDETICIRCGLCAIRCPSGAITMERFTFKEMLTCQID